MKKKATKAEKKLATKAKVKIKAKPKRKRKPTHMSKDLILGLKALEEKFTKELESALHDHENDSGHDGQPCHPIRVVFCAHLLRNLGCLDSECIEKLNELLFEYNVQAGISGFLKVLGKSPEGLKRVVFGEEPPADMRIQKLVIDPDDPRGIAGAIKEELLKAEGEAKADLNFFDEHSEISTD